MSLAKKRYVESAKKRVREKLKEIHEQQNAVLQYVTTLVEQAEVESDTLLAMTNKKQFMQCYIPVLRQLDDCVDKLSKVQASLPDDELETSGADSDESEDSETSSTTMMSIAMSQVSSVTTCLQKKSRKPVHLEMPSRELGSQDYKASPSPEQTEETSPPVSATMKQEANPIVITPTDSPPVTPPTATPVPGSAAVSECSAAGSTTLSVLGSSAAPVPGFTAVSMPGPSAVPVPDSVAGFVPGSSVVPVPGFTAVSVPGSTAVPTSVSTAVPAAGSAIEMGGFLEQLTALKEAGVKEIPPEMRQILKQLLLSSPAETKPLLASPGCPVALMPAMPDSYGLGPCIPQMELTRGPLDVLVIEVEDPWMFWMQPYNPELEVLNSALELYHSRLQSSDAGFMLEVPPAVGMVVTAQFVDGTWYRACIVTVFDFKDKAGTPLFCIEVFYLDFGNREILTLRSRVRPLHGNFAKLPSQVIPGALAGVGPPDGSLVWEDEQRLAFAQNVNDKQLQAVIEFSHGCPLVLVKLYTADCIGKDFSGQSFMIDIGDSLVQTRQACKIENDAILKRFSEHKCARGHDNLPIKSSLTYQDLVKTASPRFVTIEEPRKPGAALNEVDHLPGKNAWGKQRSKSPVDSSTKLRAPSYGDVSKPQTSQGEAKPPPYHQSPSYKATPLQPSQGREAPHLRHTSGESRTSESMSGGKERPGRGRGTTVRRYGPSPRNSRSSSKEAKPGRVTPADTTLKPPLCSPSDGSHMGGKGKGPNWDTPTYAKPILAAAKDAGKKASTSVSVSKDKLSVSTNTQARKSPSDWLSRPKVPGDGKPSTSVMEHDDWGTKPSDLPLHHCAPAASSTGCNREAKIPYPSRGKSNVSHRLLQSREPEHTERERGPAKFTSPDRKTKSYTPPHPMHGIYDSPHYKMYSPRPPTPPGERASDLDNWDSIVADTGSPSTPQPVWQGPRSQSEPLVQKPEQAQLSSRSLSLDGDKEFCKELTRDKSCSGTSTPFAPEHGRSNSLTDDLQKSESHNKRESVGNKSIVKSDSQKDPATQKLCSTDKPKLPAPSEDAAGQLTDRDAGPKKGQTQSLKLEDEVTVTSRLTDSGCRESSDVQSQISATSKPDAPATSTDEFLTPQQRLKNYGLPTKLPASCPGKDKFEAWLSEKDSASSVPNSTSGEEVKIIGCKSNHPSESAADSGSTAEMSPGTSVDPEPIGITPDCKVESQTSPEAGHATEGKDAMEEPDDGLCGDGGGEDTGHVAGPAVCTAQSEVVLTKSTEDQLPEQDPKLASSMSASQPPTVDEENDEKVEKPPVEIEREGTKSPSASEERGSGEHTVASASHVPEEQSEEHHVAVEAAHDAKAEEKDMIESASPGIDDQADGATPKEAAGQPEESSVRDDATLQLLRGAGKASAETVADTTTDGQLPTPAATSEVSGKLSNELSNPANLEPPVESMSSMEEPGETRSPLMEEPGETRSPAMEGPSPDEENTEGASPAAESESGSSVEDVAGREIYPSTIMPSGGQTGDFPHLQVQIPEDCCVRFLMSHIISPGSFYIHLVVEGVDSIVDGLMGELRKHFTNDSKGAIWRRFMEPEVMSSCVARFSEDNELYRALVISIGHDEQQGQVKVFFVDFGNSEWTSFENIFPLPPHFRSTPAQALHCQLAGVRPAASDGQHWSDAASQAFTDMTGYEKTLLGYVIAPNLAATSISISLESPSLKLVVADTSGEADVWVNEELVGRDLAVTPEDLGDHRPADESEMKGAVVPFQHTVPLSSDGDLPDNWDPMAEDYQSLRNAYDVEIEDAGVALTGYRARDEERICKFYARGKKCWRGEYCAYDHSDPAGAGQVTTDKVEVVCAQGVECSVELPEEGTWVAVEITAVHNPGRFYVSFPFGTRPIQDIMKDTFNNDCGYEGSDSGESFESLKDGMNDYYNKHSFSDRDLTLTGLGEIVAVHYKEDKAWYRARCIDRDPDHQRIKVFYVDFGNSEWVDERRVRRMRVTFMHVPFQAVECFMPIDSTSESGIWTREARDEFFELIDGRVLFAHILRRNVTNGTLSVDLYDTDTCTKEDEILIADELIKHGLAKRAADLSSLARHPSEDSGMSESGQSAEMKMVPG